MRRSELLEASRLNVVARSEPRSAVVEAAESERRPQASRANWWSIFAFNVDGIFT